MRMSADERRMAILQAARPLFAMNGLKGTSVREIAKAADVSEALLYKHFSSKDEIYGEMLNYAGAIGTDLVKGLDAFKPGTEKLIILIYLLFDHILFEVPGQKREQDHHERLLFNSFLEDGEYARRAFRSIEKACWDLVEECYREAQKNAHLVETPIPFARRAWFVHHLAMALNLCHLPEEPAFEYEGEKEELIQHAALFALRGIGLTDEAIKHFFDPAKLKEIRQALYPGKLN